MLNNFLGLSSGVYSTTDIDLSDSEVPTMNLAKFNILFNLFILVLLMIDQPI